MVNTPQKHGVQKRLPQKPAPQKAAAWAIPVRMIGLRATPVALILLGLTFMIFHRAAALPVERLRTAVTDAVAPVMAAASQPFVTFANSFEGVRTMRAVKADNIRLKEENARLLQWYEAALKFQAENQSLHDLLNVKADPSLTFITTRVVADPGGSFVKSVLLPSGSADNVHKGNAVMSGRGLLGRVTETGRHSSRVLLITDLNSRIPVTIQNTRTRAVLAGKNGDLLQLERLPIDAGVEVGSRVMTSGDGGQLPPDIPIGTIVTVGPDGVFVKPLADIDGSSWVQVINADVDDSLATGEITSAPGPR